MLALQMLHVLNASPAWIVGECVWRGDDFQCSLFERFFSSLTFQSLGDSQPNIGIVTRGQIVEADGMDGQEKTVPCFGGDVITQ
jgi:hypothetical protein